MATGLFIKRFVRVTMKPTLAIIIVTWNSIQEIGDCLCSLGEYPSGWQVWVVDNASSDGTVALIKKLFPRTHLIENSVNVGFARASNQILQQTDSDYCLLLNPDTVASQEAIRIAIREIESHPKAGILTVHIKNTDGTTQPSCFGFFTPWVNFLCLSGLYKLYPKQWRSRRLLSGWWDHAASRRVDYVSGAFLLARREAINRVGLLAEEYFMYAEDMEWCYRMWASGFEVWYTPATSITHHGARSRNQTPNGIQIFHQSKYEYSRRYFGGVKTRFVQLSDMFGYKIKYWKHYLFGDARCADRVETLKLMQLGYDAARRAFWKG